MATYSLFNQNNTSASVAGPSSGISYGGDLIVGLQFYVTEGSCWLNGYWWWVQAGTNPNPTSSQDFVLWQFGNATATCLTNSSVASGSLAAGWNYMALSNPVQLTPNCAYVAATHMVGNFNDTFDYFGSGDPGNGASSGPLVAVSNMHPGWSAGEDLLQNGLYTVASDVLTDFPGNADPNGDGWANYWIDVEISDQPPNGYEGSYRIWPNMPNPITIQDDNASNFNLGTEFTLSEHCLLDNIWYFSPPGATELATDCGIWTVPGGSVSGTLVAGASVHSPTWLTPSGGAAAATDGWIYTNMGSSVTLPPGTYKASIYNQNASVQAWSPKWTYYYESTGPGYGGFTQGPIAMPDTAHANQAWEYDGSDGGATPPYSNGTQEPGQGTFTWALSSGMALSTQYPFLYVDGLYEVFLVDPELTVLNLTAASAGLAGASAAAYQPTVTIDSTGTGSASATATAYEPSINLGPPAGKAGATATAYEATITITVGAGLASASATAYNASVTTSSGADANAGPAGATSSAYGPTVAISLSGVGVGQATATAYNATVSTANLTNASAGVASASTTAYAPSVSITVTPWTATATATAYNAGYEPAIIAANIKVVMSVGTNLSVVNSQATTIT